MPADPIAALRERFPEAAPRPSADLPAVDVPAAAAVAALRFLRDEHAYDFLVDLTAVDWGVDASPRFTVVWHLFSTTHHGYVRVAAACPSFAKATEGAPSGAAEAAHSMPSVTGLWAGANWHERECYDMFGITFTGHPDLRRILMWDSYPHHPLRKDFPLAGHEGVLSDPEISAETHTKVIPAPMAGGPFVAAPGEMNLTDAEPRAKDESWNEASEKPQV
jgi:NADH-quinone oxidoreductase subunit C